MLITNKRRYIKKHVIGGAGIFDTIVNFLKRITGSTAAKAIASKLGSVAKTEIGKKVIEAGKTAAREVGLKAIDVGKDAAIAKAKALIDGLVPKNQDAGITQKSTGSGVGANARANAISIQDLVKRLNTGSGLRVA